MRVAIVGCGKIADQHLNAIRRVAGSEVVAVCDLEPLMAKQLAERYSIRSWYADLGRMLDLAKPDVVHVTTPPQSHHAIGFQCLDAGSHVLLEKPFTVNAAEAEALLNIARQRGLTVTAGHNYQFTSEMLEMRRLVRDGYLGGAPSHMESHWSYDLGDISYVGPVLGNPQHWVRRLPGQLLHNIISHGIARLAEFLDDELDEPLVIAHQSRTLRDLGGQDVLDELRVMLRDSKGTTAMFCFTTQVRPGLNQFRLYGPRNSLLVDLASGSLIQQPGAGHKSYLMYLVPPLHSARSHLRNAVRNAVAIARWKLYQDSGMKELIQRFHNSISRREQPPIPYREILLTARIMDRVFARAGQVDCGSGRSAT